MANESKGAVFLVPAWLVKLSVNSFNAVGRYQMPCTVIPKVRKKCFGVLSNAHGIMSSTAKVRNIAKGHDTNVRGVLCQLRGPIKPRFVVGP